MAPTRITPHRAGTTRGSYSRDGTHLFTTGCDGVVRRFKLGSSDEPVVLDALHDDVSTGIATSNEKLVTCSEDATVSIFDIKGTAADKLCRCSLPIREVAFSPDGAWVAIASDETKVRIVNVAEMTRVMELTASLAKSIKHISFHPSGNTIASVDTNGVIRVYSLSTEEPSMLESLSGIVPIVHEPSSNVSCKVAWHPDGQSFAAPTSAFEVVVHERSGWTRQATFKATPESGHKDSILDLAWSPNGAYMATCSLDKTILIWATKTQQVVQTLQVAEPATQLIWHPQKNTLSWTTDQGDLYTQEEIIKQGSMPHERPLHASPIIVAEVRTNGAPRVNGHTSELIDEAAAGSDGEDAGMGDYGDEDLNEALEDGAADWIDDDDGGGYIPNLDSRKRAADGYHTPVGSPAAKRSRATAASFTLHAPVQPGSTPFRGGRRYLALNNIGWIWTVEQEDHNTVTVEFHDREAHRGYHFSDGSIFTFACIDEEGALFASGVRTDLGGGKVASVVHYRPHASWAAYAHWTVSLPDGEDIQAIALSSSGVVVCTSKGYVRIYSLNGVPKTLFINKHAPLVAAIARGNYVLTVSNSHAKGDGSVALSYMVYHTGREEIIQQDDALPLNIGAGIKSLFFSDDGFPFIYTTDGLLSCLAHWRQPGQAQWRPVLDTNLLERRIGKDENYWPVGCTLEQGGQFQCIILKGAERHPYFPRPITSTLAFCIPIAAPDHVAGSVATLENAAAKERLFASLAEETLEIAVAAGDADEESRLQGEQDVLEAQLDRSLIQLLNLACKAEQDARGLDLCIMMRRPGSLDAALKVAGHHHRLNLAQRINELAEERA